MITDYDRENSAPFDGFESPVPAIRFAFSHAAVDLGNAGPLISGGC
jgi:hypothetical protein